MELSSHLPSPAEMDIGATVFSFNSFYFRCPVIIMTTLLRKYLQFLLGLHMSDFFPGKMPLDFLCKITTIRAPSKQIEKRSKQNMYWAASLGKKRKDFPLLMLAHCERREFCLDSVFSKNAPYKQKHIFHF